MLDHRENRDCILVLGMHRSGTSAMSGLLQKLGYDLGQDLMESNIYNQSGYYENNKVVNLNDQLLDQSQSSWHDLSYELITDNCQIDTDDFLDKLNKIIKTEFDSISKIAIKDPRIALFLPNWLQALIKLGFNLKIVICLRDVRQVARSLWQRNRFPYEKSLSLWLIYNLLIEKYSRGHDRIFVNYNSLLENPEHFVKKLGIDLSMVTMNFKIWLNINLNHDNRTYDSKFVPAKILGFQETLFAAANDNENIDESISNELFVFINKKISANENLTYLIFSNKIHPILENEYLYQSVLQTKAFQELFFTAGDFLNYNKSFNKETRLRAAQESYATNYFAQLFYDVGNGFNEENSIRSTISKFDSHVIFDIEEISGIKSLRLDPINDKCILLVNVVKLILKDQTSIELPFKSNHSIKENGILYFNVIDPQLILEIPSVLNNSFSHIYIEFEFLDLLPEFKELIKLKKLAIEKNQILAKEKLQNENINKALEKDLKIALQNVISLKRKLETKSEEIRQTKAEIDHLTATIVADKRRRQELHKTISDINELNIHITSDLAKKTQSLESLEVQINNLKNSIVTQQRDFSA